MQPNPPGPDSQKPRARIEPGQTLIFIGDHTSPDSPGYVRVVSDIVSRFHPSLKPNFISAGGKGQTAAALGSRALLDILISSHPDCLVISIGLTDAVREPVLHDMLPKYRQQLEEAEEGLDKAIGPEYRVHREDMGPAEDIGKEPEPQLQRLELFRQYVSSALSELDTANIHPILLTTVLIGDDRRNPINIVLKQYNRALRELARSHQVVLVDVEKAFGDVMDRAAHYKQKAAFTNSQGDLNPPGEALLARTFLNSLGLLPSPGYRPLR